MKNIFLSLFLLIITQTYAQKESDNWYFGMNAGLNFSNGEPVALTDGKINTNEGCATISDSTGRLLFYTDGRTVWNKNHQIMPNGEDLKGDTSSTQSAIVIPKPGSTSIYYIFTCTLTAYPDGLSYSVVDMTLDAGLGDITSQKNLQLATPVCEKLTAVKNANDNDYWVMAHGYNNNQFLAYKISNTGVNITPVISSVGQVVDTESRRTIGYLKFSPSGKKLISCNSFYIGAELYDFNASTGRVSNPKKVNNLYNIYGVEFSPSEKIAYISIGAESATQLFQYDLTAANIPSSQISIYSPPQSDDPGYFGAMQIAKNGKIYGTIRAKDFVFAIQKPNILGPGCDFVLNAVSLKTGQCRYGLPQFIQSFFKIDAKIDVKNNCLGDNTIFSISADKTINSVLWDFGDGTTSTEINPTHLYSSPGLYIISAIVNDNTELNESIHISAIPSATKPTNLLVCDDNNDGVYTFDLTIQDTAILNGQDPNLFSVNYFLNNIAIQSPSNYTNLVPYEQEIITAEVSNKTNEACKSNTVFNVNVFDTPKPKLPVAIQDLTACDNSTVGDNRDGKIIFDLTLRANTILNGQSPSKFLISYYRDQLMTQVIALPNSYQNINRTETIFIKVTNKDNNSCIAVTSFKLMVFALPVITNNVTLKQCDDDNDGFSAFNLEEAIDKITTNSTLETITFHKTYYDAQNNTDAISNKIAYRNQIVSSDKVYVRIVNNNDCFAITELNLIVSTTQIPSAYNKVFIQCDDTLAGTNNDGIATFDFSNVTLDLKENVFPTGQLLVITYYQNIEDALSEKNAISDISNYRNTSSPTTQKIFIRVDNKLNNDCLGLGGYITLKVESIPVVQNLKKVHCDDNHDGLYAFDTLDLEQEILNGLTNVKVTYFDEDNNQLSSPLPNPFITSSKVLKVLITHKTATACSFSSTITFVVDDLPEIFAIDPLLTTVCDDELNPALQDGKYAFDTSSFESVLLGSQTGMIINYYDCDNNLLPSPLPNPFVTNSQNIKVEVVNPNNNTCTASTIIPFIINPVPKINLKGEELICSNLSTFTKEIDAGLLDLGETNNYSYTWFFNGNLIPEAINYNLTVNKEGIFEVEVGDKQTYCSRKRTINVSASNIASNVISIVDESNTISISVTGNGDYVFALDDQNGYYQTENSFRNVDAGIHTIYIKDKNGCGTAVKEVAVLGIPNFFTPNQDGYNDYWNIEGVDLTSNTKTKIQIFDRYGKLLSQISPMGQGWDGNYLGTQMPGDDYWYVIELEAGKILKGHFSLKR